MKIKRTDITEFSDFKFGNAENKSKGTGCTVIICEDGAVGGVDVRGGAPATRETDLLRSENSVNKVHAVVMSGGSSFGLEAASGVMRELSEKGIGIEFRNSVIPIVCGASLFDLEVGDPKAFPDVNMGIEAVCNAYNDGFRHGCHGAGTGATVGKMLGTGRAMKTGLGVFACSDEVLEVGAVVAVNAFGDVYNGAGNIIAGLRSEKGGSIFGTIKAQKGMIHSTAGKEKSGSERKENEPEVEEFRKRMAAAAESIRETFIKSEKSKRPAAAASHVRSESAPAVNIYKAFAKPAADRQMHEEDAEKASAAAEIPVKAPSEELVVPGSRIVKESPEKHFAAEEQKPLSEETAENAGYEAAKHAAPDESNTDGVSEHASDASSSSNTGRLTLEFEMDDFYGSEDPEVPEETKSAEESEDRSSGLSAEDLGYDIPFNTTIGCLVTNAKLTKSQANKLASILHDAYARAIKPVHGTMDGDTIFVLASGKTEVNFNAFAALAADVVQYAVIDGALSAKSGYGLPASKDM